MPICESKNAKEQALIPEPQVQITLLLLLITFLKISLTIFFVLKNPFNSKEDASKLELPSIVPFLYFFLAQDLTLKNLLVGLASRILIFLFSFLNKNFVIS